MFLYTYKYNYLFNILNNSNLNFNSLSVSGVLLEQETTTLEEDIVSYYNQQNE